MHVFVSDLHMTDADAAGAVSDSQLSEFVDSIELLVGSSDKKVVMVFVGDILELLRSLKWQALWTQHKSAPWSAVGKGFRNFSQGYAEGCAVEIAKTIQDRYANFSSKLNRLVKSGKVETAYVYGNHDYMVQLSSQLREILIKILTLSHDPNNKFELTYSDPAASLFATHGHSVDPVNWHRKTEGYWAMGDAIVLRIVNRFPSAACDEIGVALSTQIGQQLQEIENIEPISDIPLYVRWLTESLPIKKQRDKIDSVWARVVDEFLAIEDFRDEDGYGAAEYQNVRKAFSWSKNLSFAGLLAKLAPLVSAQGPPYQSSALTQARGPKRYRFVLYGHTHEPMLVPLPVPSQEPAFYVNTGCWRRVVTRASRNSSGPFAARRLASYFRVDGPDGGKSQERYHLYQEWHTV